MHHTSLLRIQLFSKFICKIQSQLRLFISIDVGNAVCKIRIRKHSHRHSCAVQQRLISRINTDVVNAVYLSQCFCQSRPAENLTSRAHAGVIVVKNRYSTMPSCLAPWQATFSEIGTWASRSAGTFIRASRSS